jgi:ATP-dependent Clp protease ATP-binding subunit ClpA
MFERFSAAARSTVSEGLLEARRRGDRRIGTQHLLLGLLHDPEGAAALGVSLAQARAGEEVLDREALAAVGIDPGLPGAPAASVQEGIGDAAGDGQVLGAAVSRTGRLPFTSGAKDVLARSVKYAATERSRLLTERHLLLALLDDRIPDPAATLLAHLGVNTDEVRARLNAA